MAAKYRSIYRRDNKLAIMSSDSKSKGWLWAVIAVLVSIIIGLVVGYKAKSDEALNEQARNHILMKDAAVMLHNKDADYDSLIRLRNRETESRQSMESAFTGRLKQEIAEKKYYQRQLAMVNTSRASRPELDTLQRRLYGSAPDDSTHTIPLFYSRQLTGDALRLPIVQHMLTNTESQLSDAKAHYGRMETSYKIEIHELGIFAESASNKVDSLYQIAEKQDKVITKLDNPWSFGLHAGYGATLSGGQVYMGPQAGASIQYKIRIRRKR